MAFIVAVLMIDYIVARFLNRKYGARIALRWIVYVALLGPAVYLRFDILVAVSLFGLFFYETKSPSKSGTWVAIGSAVKLWPAVFSLGLRGRARDRWRHLVASAIAGGIWVGLTIAISGWNRVTSPLTWQSTRGFQIESTLGSVVGLARGLGLGHIKWIFHNHSVEYQGGSSTHLTSLITPWQDAGFLLVIAILFLSFKKSSDPDKLDAFTTTVLLAIPLTLILTSAVFSPQYLMWLAPGLVLNPVAKLRRLGYVAALLTQLEMPAIYIWTFFNTSKSWLFADTVFLRDAALFLLLIFSIFTILASVRKETNQPSGATPAN